MTTIDQIDNAPYLSRPRQGDVVIVDEADSLLIKKFKKFKSYLSNDRANLICLSATTPD